MTTVCCLFVRGHVHYTAEYVTRLAAMVKRWMDRPYRFVCLSDKPKRMLPGVEIVAVKRHEGCLAWWEKMQLWRPDIGLSGRVLYLDLDTIVVNSLAPILDFDAPFALIPHEGKFRPKGGLGVVHRFNSSVMVWNAGEQSHLWERWSPAVCGVLHGDQDHIGKEAPDAATFPSAWFPRISAIRNGPVPADAKVILAKVPKNVEAARKWSWVREAWQ